MNIAAKKLKLIEMLLDTQEESVLNKIGEILEVEWELSKEQKQILDERLRQHKANPDSGKDWVDVKKHLEKQYGL